MGYVISCLRNVMLCDVTVDIVDYKSYVRSVWVALMFFVTFSFCREGCVVLSSMSGCLGLEHGRS